MFKFIASVLFLLAGYVASAQLKITFDFTNADQTIALFKKERIGAAEIDSFVNTEGVKQIMRKIKADDSCARRALQYINEGSEPKACAANFQYSFIKRNITTIDSFISRIKNSEQQIRDSLAALSYWLPPGKELKVKIVFLLGGYSSGFTFYNSDAFYIGTHQYKNDFMAIIDACKHELFHNVQHAGFPSASYMEKLERDSAYKELYAYYLASNLFLEGTAEYIADPADYAQRGKYLEEQLQHSNVNKYRVDENFYLIDEIINRAYEEGENADLGKMYAILYDWNWNNPGYYTGKLMTQALVKEYGKDCLKKYLYSNPLDFIIDYIELTRNKPELYPHSFSEKFETMIRSIRRRENKNY